jgi:hypothetical protein
MGYPGEKALWGLFERARILRRDAFKLSRQLGKTCDEIKARDAGQTESLRRDRPDSAADAEKPSSRKKKAGVRQQGQTPARAKQKAD